MKAVDVKKSLQEQHIIEQLHKYGYSDTEGKSYEELVRKLAVIRALEVDVESAENKWF
jgi:hypothetical protein